MTAGAVNVPLSEPSLWEVRVVNGVVQPLLPAGPIEICTCVPAGSQLAPVTVTVAPLVTLAGRVRLGGVWLNCWNVFEEATTPDAPEPVAQTG